MLAQYNIWEHRRNGTLAASIHQNLINLPNIGKFRAETKKLNHNNRRNDSSPFYCQCFAQSSNNQKDNMSRR